METGHQTSGVSFWLHGTMVADRFTDLLGPRSMEWRLCPEMRSIIENYAPMLNHHKSDILTYMQWHDCGKPYCLEMDPDGRRHYPNHAAVSAAVWKQAGGCQTIGTYIAQDMDFHLMRPSEAESYVKEHPNWAIMLIAAVCETHANATMFGGMTSESFKIKMSRLTKIAKRLICLV